MRKARDRGHVLEGLAVALVNIDEFIRIIRVSPTPPVAKTELMARTWDNELVREILTRNHEDGAGSLLLVERARVSRRSDELRPDDRKDSVASFQFMMIRWL